MVEEKEGIDQRQAARRHLIFYLRIFDGASSRVLGHLMDISPSGLMLLGDEPVAVNEEYRLRMLLPKEVPVGDEIFIGAVSRWCKQDGNPDYYVTGFQIQDMDAETRKSMGHLIEEFGVQGPY
jgi:PilZ domain